MIVKLRGIIMKALLLGLVVSFSGIINAQIDTTNWYPLHVGDKWEYWGLGIGYYQVEVLGDTLMPNGKTYFVLSLLDRKFQRVEGNRYVMVYNESYENEYIHYDLKGEKKSNWGFGDVFVGTKDRFGIYETGIDRNNLMGELLEWKEYRVVHIDSTVVPYDTVWMNIVDDYFPRITKGLGVTTYAYELTTLVGAVINGVGYGTLVGVNDKIEKVEHFKLFQNFPNPFNPATTLTYEIAKDGHVKLIVYNALGEAVKTLVDEFQPKSSYSVKFDATNLPSGVYLYKLQSNEYVEVRKMILTK